MTDLVYSRLLISFLVLVIVAQAVFAAVPGLDLAVSRSLTNGAGLFTATTGLAPYASAALKSAMELVAALIVLATLGAWIGQRLSGDDLRVWAFVALNLLLAPGLIVNVLLKGYLGRARPISVVEFGGTAPFTPAWQVSDACLRNCSFTSGEVSVAATLAICLTVVLWSRLGRGNRAKVAVAAALFIALVMALRLSLGRHFLSDAVFSMAISGGVAIALYPVLQVGRARQNCWVPGPADLRALAGSARQAFASLIPRKPMP